MLPAVRFDGGVGINNMHGGQVVNKVVNDLVADVLIGCLGTETDLNEQQSQYGKYAKGFHSFIIFLKANVVVLVVSCERCAGRDTSRDRREGIAALVGGGVME